MVSISMAHKPRTPVRRLSRLLNIFSRPSNHPRTASRFIQAVRSTNRAGEASIAIQNEDVMEDAIVVTSLEKIPFCCHADLILMDREQLLTAASVLNERLPAALHIDTDRPDSYIRNSIEFIVGLKNGPPDAPAKPATPSRKFVPSSPISPLARHSRSRNSHLAASPSPLGDVTEEEGLEGPPIATSYWRCKRLPLKRRKLAQGPVSPTPPYVQPRHSILSSSGSTPAQRITRSQSTRTTRPLQPPSDRILRSRSQRVNPKSSIIVTPHPSLAGFCTPKKRIRSFQVQPSSASTSTSPSCPLAESSASYTPSPTPRITRRECRRDSSVEREVEVVTGLQKMNVPLLDSDD
ncbi:hypothetical protein BDM02DRAFT_3265342 [Thelephora ganbajun]|uniref:Uncharacterized protein n=1 Tax=Thelephora ganbajun TaxID=370292 RepID=A0ACB6ZW02_THEGA|nr:hypothetical protein BDM02DRAFT_3265342 [Thelephora ganbajun]